MRPQAGGLPGDESLRHNSFLVDHEPAHFHARYGDVRATFAIDAMDLLEGYLPPRIQGLVAEWAALHRLELRRIEPLV